MNKIYLFLLLLVLSSVTLFAQDADTRKTITVFNMSNRKWEIKREVVATVDEKLRQTLNKLKDFTIRGLDYSLASHEVGEFIDTFNELKKEGGTSDQPVTIGEETIQPEDVEKILDSEFVVVPVLEYFSVDENQSGDALVEMQAKFVIVAIDDMRPAAQFTVETTGIEPTKAEATADALEDIPIQFNYEIGRIPQLQGRSGIIDILGRWEVVIEYGKALGVRIGDQYAIVDTRLTESGDTISEQTGLLVVKKVKENLSFARVVFSDGRPRIGDKIKKIPRLGTDTTIYAHGLLGLDGPPFQALHVGVRQSLTRGLYRIKPVLGLELPFIFVEGGSPFPFGFPLTLHGGAELNWYLGRFIFAPSVTGGITGTFPTGGTDPFLLSHAGLKAELYIHCIVSNSVSVFIEGGYSYWFGLTDFPSYGGILVGAGVRIRY